MFIGKVKVCCIVSLCSYPMKFKLPLYGCYMCWQGHAQNAFRDFGVEILDMCLRLGKHLCWLTLWKDKTGGCFFLTTHFENKSNKSYVVFSFWTPVDWALFALLLIFVCALFSLASQHSFHLKAKMTFALTLVS